MADDPPVPRDPKRLIIIAVGLLLALNVTILAVYATKTDDQVIALPSAIVRTFPTCGQVAFAQQPIGATFATGYHGELSLDGTPLPLDEYDARSLEQGTALWQPGDGRTVSRMAPGLHVMTIRYTPDAKNEPGQDPGAFACEFKVG
jgi:hypothetical protein